MKNIKYKISLLLCFLINLIGYSQSKLLTLEQAINLGIENNGDIKAINLEIEKLNTLKKTSFGLDKTDFGVQYGQYNSLNNDLGFTINQNFKFPTVYKHQKSLNQAYVNTGEQQKLVSQNDLIKEIKLNYYQIVFLNNVNQLLKFQDSLYQSFFKGTQLKYEAGDGTYLEQITAESKWMEVNAKISENESNIKIYKSILQALIFQTQPVDEIDNSSLKKELNIELDSTALVSNPKLIYYKKIIDIKEQEYRVNKSNVLPDFSVGYFNNSMVGNYNVNGVNTYLDGSYRFQGVQMTISIPIFVKDDIANIKAKKIDKQIAETQANNYQVYLKSQFERVVQDYYKYKSLLDYYENLALVQSDLMIDNATKSYKSGNINYLEYIQVMNNSTDIKNNYLNLLNNYNQSTIAIEYLMGVK